MTKKKDIKQVIRLMRSKGYDVNEKPNELNIVGVRSKSGDPTRFNDWLYVFWKNEANRWEFKAFPITTDPSINYLKDPLSSTGGTAILKEGQYKNSYKLGYHKGQYRALVQKNPVTIYRDYDRNALYDFKSSKHTGMYGINIHRASPSGTTQYIKDYSAGCQVFANASDFDDFINLAEAYKLRYGNEFTYTLIDEWQREQLLKRNIFIAFMTILIASIIIYIYRKKVFSLLSKR